MNGRQRARGSLLTAVFGLTMLGSVSGVTIAAASPGTHPAVAAPNAASTPAAQPVVPTTQVVTTPVTLPAGLNSVWIIVGLAAAGIGAAALTRLPDQVLTNTGDTCHLEEGS